MTKRSLFIPFAFFFLPFAPLSATDTSVDEFDEFDELDNMKDKVGCKNVKKPSIVLALGSALYFGSLMYSGGGKAIKSSKKIKPYKRYKHAIRMTYMSLGYIIAAVLPFGSVWALKYLYDKNYGVDFFGDYRAWIYGFGAFVLFFATFATSLKWHMSNFPEPKKSFKEQAKKMGRYLNPFVPAKNSPKKWSKKKIAGAVTVTVVVILAVIWAVFGSKKSNLVIEEEEEDVNEM